MTFQKIEFIQNIGDPKYTAFCLQADRSDAGSKVMTSEEFSKHLDQVMKEEIYCNCPYYDDAHLVVKTEEEKQAWNFILSSYHQRDTFYTEIPGNAKLVARPSRWGSPFKLKNHTLEESLELYHSWLHEKLEENPEFLDDLKRNPKYVKEGENPFYKLVCYCDPSIEIKCHATILLQHLWGACNV